MSSGVHKVKHIGLRNNVYHNTLSVIGEEYHAVIP